MSGSSRRSDRDRGEQNSVADLFSNLYPYRERQTKSNLEDWLTECLAAVLKSLSADQWCAFLSLLTGFEASSEGAISQASPTVQTQVFAGQFGRPDLVVFVDEQPAIVFESKVGHSVAEQVNAAGYKRHQLHRYAEWMKERRTSALIEQRLIFLTHITQAPEDFLALHPPEGYFGVARQVESWGALARKLLAVTQPEGERAASRSLAKALYEMLENEGMANEFPGSSDVAALELFLGHGSTIENLVAQMWKKASQIANCSNQNREVIGPQIEFGAYSAYRYVNRTKRTPSHTFVQTGLWFPELYSGWNASNLGAYEAHGGHVYLLFGSDTEGMFEDIQACPAEWFRPFSDFLTTRPLADFQGSPDERACSILEWVSAEGSKLRTFLLEQQLAT